MKARDACVIGLALITLLGTEFPLRAASCGGVERSSCKVRAPRPTDPGMLTVVNGSGIKITPYGEVIVPAGSVMTVKDAADGVPAAGTGQTPARPRQGTAK